MADSDTLELDLEGCEKNHCHGARSLKQPDVIEHLNENGTRKACHRPAGWGTRHLGSGRCKRHGGATPGADIKAAKDQLAKIREESAHTFRTTYGAPIEISAEDAIQEEIYRTAGHVAWLGRIIAQMESGELVWGLVEEVIEPDQVEVRDGSVTSGVTGRFRAGANVWLQMYQAERKHLVQVSKTAIDAGISERMVNLIEDMAGTYMQAFERILESLDLTAAQRSQVPAAVVKELSVIAGKVEEG